MVFTLFSIEVFAIFNNAIGFFYNLHNSFTPKLCDLHEVANYGLIFFDFVLQYYITEGQIA